MKIGIDASRAFQKKRTGIEEYSYQVIKHLRNELRDAQVVLYVRSEQESVIREKEFILPKSWRVKVIKFPYLWTQLGLSLELLLHPVDVLFVPAHVVPIIHPKNTIVTVHGLEYEFFPEGYSFWARIYMRWSIKFSCKWARSIIAVSNNTKNDLIKLYDIKKDKISVIYEGYNSNFQFPISNFQSISNDKILNYKPYLLFIGRLEKRKNIEGILDAYKILVEKYKLPHSLLLAGKPGFGFEIIKLKIDNLLKIENCLPAGEAGKLKIVNLGYIDEARKWQLLSNADIFLFPSFYEGFGLPILEAQVLGVPVVTSNISSLPEVGGESVLYADPNKPKKITEAAYKLISDENLKNSIIKKGHENIKRFAWEKCAEKINKVLIEK